MITEHGDPGTCGMPHRQLQTSDRLASLLRQCALVEEELLRQHERQKQHTAELGWLDLALMDAGIEMKRKQADGLQEQVNAHAQLRQFQHEATAAAKACAFARKCAATAAREAAQLEADNANAEAEVDAAVGHLENVRADVAALQHIYSILSDAIKRSNRFNLADILGLRKGCRVCRLICIQSSPPPAVHATISCPFSIKCQNAAGCRCRFKAGGITSRLLDCP